VEAGMVEAKGEKKGRAWHLSATLYRRFGKKAAYVLQRGFEPLQQEQMVLQYVEKHGSISRGEAAELCRIGSMQAYRLLKRLETRGEIGRSRGSTKGVRYERASK
jgi:ATP-dependent DNA helicase RecG